MFIMLQLFVGVIWLAFLGQLGALLAILSPHERANMFVMKYARDVNVERGVKTSIAVHLFTLGLCMLGRRWCDILTCLVSLCLGVALPWARDVAEDAAFWRNGFTNESRSEAQVKREAHADLQKECKELKDKSEKAETQLAAIRKQAENQADEYMRLLLETKSLKEQLRSLDKSAASSGEKKDA